MGNLIEGFENYGVSGLMNVLSGIITDVIPMMVEKAKEFVSVGLKFAESIANGILNARFKVWETLNDIIVSMSGEVSSWIGSHANEIMELGIEIIQLISKGILSAGDVISSNIGKFIPLIANAFLKYHQTLFQIGVQIISAIGRGIVENRNELQNMASKTVQNIVTAIRDNTDYWPHPPYAGGEALRQ